MPFVKLIVKKRLLSYNLFMKSHFIKCDLHLHTNVSDGDFTVEYVVGREKNLGLDVISVTDHDTVDGVAEAVARGEALGLKVLPGVELSTMDDREVHMLGYNVNYLDKNFTEELARLRDMRKRRNRMMLAKLKEYGIDVSEDDMLSVACGTTVGRAHIAKAMVKKGYCQSMNQAFDEYLGFGKKAYVKEKRITPEEGIDLILRFGGTPVLAHPYSLEMDEKTAAAFVARLTAAGLKGIESEYFSHTNEDKEKYGRLADKYGLIKTGGSDFHRENSDDARQKYAFLDSVCLAELKIDAH